MSQWRGESGLVVAYGRAPGTDSKKLDPKSFGQEGGLVDVRELHGEAT
ncbi:hypothetical protein [Streptomyces sp. NPDC088360]